jgi:hypothetical protein
MGGSVAGERAEQFIWPGCRQAWRGTRAGLLCLRVHCPGCHGADSLNIVSTEGGAMRQWPLSLSTLRTDGGDQHRETLQA